MPATISRSALLPAGFLTILFCCVYFIAGYNQALNWDDEASVDIALGIRPQFMIDTNGLPNKTLPYDQIVQKNVFSSADYEQHNSANEVVRSVWRDNSNSMVYYLTLHYFIKLVGVNFHLMRLLSIVLAGINLLLAFAIARRWSNGSRYVPFLVLILLGSNPVFFSVAFAIRGYMLCTTFLLLSSLVWLNILQTGRYNRVLLFALLSVAAVLTHYFSLAIILFQFLYLFMHAYRNRINRGWLNLGAGMLVFLVPLIVWYVISLDVGIRNMVVLDAGWNNLAREGQGWAATGFNALKQLFNATAYFIGFDVNVGLLPRIVWQCIALLHLGSICFMLIKTRLLKERISLLLCIAIGAILLYTVKSISAGHFMIFEKKYLLFIVPFFIIGIVAAIDAVFRQHPSLKLPAQAALISMLLISVITFATTAYKLDKKGQATRVKNTGGSLATSRIIINDTRVLRRVGRLLSVQLQPQDTIIYSRRQTAHRLNYFLRERPDIYQQIDSLQGPDNTINIKTRSSHYDITIRNDLAGY